MGDGLGGDEVTGGLHSEVRSRQSRRLALVALLALVLGTGALFVAANLAPTGRSPAAEGDVLSVREECQQALTYPGRTNADKDWLRKCVHALATPTVVSSPTAGQTPTVAPTPAPSPTVPPTVSPSVTPTPSPTTTSAPPTTPPVTPPVTPSPTPGDEWALLRANAGPDIPTQTMVCPGSGFISLNTAGAVFEGWTLDNCSIDVNAPNITLRNLRLVNMVDPELWAIHLAAVAKGTVITDVEVVGRDRALQSVQYAVYLRDGANVTITRGHFHRCADCVQGEHVVMRDTWIHEMANIPGRSHVDGFQCNSTCDGTLIEHNYIDMLDMDQTGCISFFADFGTPRNATARNNYLLGGGWTLYGGDPAATNIKILDNIVVPGVYGWLSHFNKNGSGNLASGNHKPDGTPLLP